VLSHPSDKNKNVARVGHPNEDVARVGHPNEDVARVGHPVILLFLMLGHFFPIKGLRACRAEL
jgi:hypothetical protein